jgi:hypothetical protein
MILLRTTNMLCSSSKSKSTYMLPPFNEMGYLPPGIYEITWTEFVDRFGFNAHRQNILTGLQSALLLLAQANCRRVYLGGSFVSNKEYPNDFDGCYDDMNIDYDLLDPIFDEDLTAQQERFGGELLADPVFQGFLQTDRDGVSRGIIALDPRELLG